MELKSDGARSPSTSASLGPCDNDVNASAETLDGPATRTVSTVSSCQLESHTDREDGDHHQHDGGEGEADIEDEFDSDDNKSEYSEDDVLFDEFKADPHELHRSNSTREPMGEGGGC